MRDTAWTRVFANRTVLGRRFRNRVDGYRHFAILVDDGDGVVGELREKGYEIEAARIVGPDRQSFIDDLDGNAIELHQIGTATS